VTNQVDKNPAGFHGKLDLLCTDFRKAKYFLLKDSLCKLLQLMNFGKPSTNLCSPSLPASGALARNHSHITVGVTSAQDRDELTAKGTTVQVREGRQNGRDRHQP